LKKKIFFLLLLAACKSAPVVQAPSGEDASKYYPLSVGNSWTYEEKSARKRETIKIVGQDGDWFFDDHRGRLRYESDGVRDNDRYLLHTPLAVGQKWTAVENLVVQRFEVVSMDASLVTQAGAFTHCAVVRNEQPLPKGKFVTEWTYAPRVGLAQIVTSTIDQKGQQTEQTRLQLVAYQVK
jgi:hypothetical protein